MYEDLSAEHLKKGDEDEGDEDSGTWSFSYPSYSRFTFTGKTKSRLGRSHSRLNQLTASRDNASRIKGDNVNSVLTNVDTGNIGLSSQGPKTPGMSWLQKDKLSSSNSFTPGSLFRQSTVGNDSGVDVSSNTNFLCTLKNDSVQNSSCKQSLMFNTPFKFGENKQGSSLTELNQMLNPNSFPKLKSFDKNYENKENEIIEQSSGQLKNCTAYNVFKKKENPTSDKYCEPLPSVALGDIDLKTNNDKLLDELNKPLYAPFTDDTKIDDEPSNSPIDLSSGKCLALENIFCTSFQSEREPNSEQPKENTKEIMNKDEVIAKETMSSDGLSSILPTFLAPVNKIKSNEVVKTTMNDLSGTSATVGKPTITGLPVISKEIPKSNQQVRTGVNSWYSSNIPRKLSFKPPGELKPTSSHGHIAQNISNEPLENILGKNNDIVISNKHTNENAAANNYDQLSAIARVSNGNYENSNSVVSTEKLSKAKTDPHLQTLNHLPDSNILNLTNNAGSKNHLGEVRLKTPIVNSQTIEACKSVPMATMNSAVSNLSYPDPPNDSHARVTHHLKFNSKTPIPLSSNLQEHILPLKKCPQGQLSYDSLSMDCSAKSNEQVESLNQRVEKESKLSVQHQLVSVNQNQLPLSNEPLQCLQKGPEISVQKTYLAPHQSSDHRISKDFPHVKPDAPQLINNRLNSQAVKKQASFKMSGPRSLLSRSNTELYVNGKEYTTLSMLGRGGSSEVYQVLDQRSSKLMAIKCVDLSMVDKTIAEGYLNEIDLLSKLQGCSSVIRMFDYEYVQDDKMLYVVMEKGDTDLSQLIRDISKTKKISMSMIIYYWTEMLTAVRDIHEKGIIHSDLKPANFLLVSGRLKLIDFGIASSQGDMTSVFKEVTTGTWNYMSPEAIKTSSASAKGFKITYKSDVWSLGCILYNLLYGKTPFSHITNTWAKLQAIADSSHQVEFPEVGAPLVLAEALQSCLRREPHLRPTVAELLALPYHANGDTRHLAAQIRSILPHEWSKISHLFQELKVNEEEKNITGNTS